MDRCTGCSDVTEIILKTVLNTIQFHVFLTFPQQQILDFSYLKEVADDNFKFDKNGSSKV